MVYIDFETRSRADIKRVGAWMYSRHESTDAHCMAYAIDDEPVDILLPPFSLPPRLAQMLAQGAPVCAHNCLFELAIWRNVMQPKYRWPEVSFAQWRDTMAQAGKHALPRKLELCAEALGLPLKDREGYNIMLQLCRPDRNGEWVVDPVKFNKLYRYCKKDVEIERAIAKRLSPLSAGEQKIFALDLAMNVRGIKLDVAAVGKAISVLNAHIEFLNAETKRRSKGKIDKMSRRAVVLNYLKENEVLLEGYTKKHIEDAIANPKIDESIKALLAIRQELGKTSTAKYTVMQSMADTDNRVRDTLLYHGADTGRWSGRGIQFQNFPKKVPKNLDTVITDLREFGYEAFTFLYPKPIATLSGILRGMIVPDEGCYLLIADYASIEARVVCWLAGEHRALKLFRENGDPYITMANAIYGVSDIKKGDPRRDLGKAAVLGCGYGMGATKFQYTCETAGTTISATLAERAVFTYRTQWSNVPKFWYALNDAAIAAVRNPGKARVCGRISYLSNRDFLFCKLPSGRTISYFKPFVQDNDWGRPELNYWAYEKGKLCKAHSYGGSLAENVTQATARDIMADAMLRLDKAGLPIILTVHDELIVEAPFARTLKEMLDIIHALPSWSEGCPIVAEGFSATRYKKG